MTSRSDRRCAYRFLYLSPPCRFSVVSDTSYTCVADGDAAPDEVDVDFNVAAAVAAAVAADAADVADISVAVDCCCCLGGR